VARVLGLNLSEEIGAGHLTERDYAEMVTRCRGCPLVNACQEWLSECRNDCDAPMDGCRNGARLQQLRRLH
jgi:hypothetical protein